MVDSAAKRELLVVEMASGAIVHRLDVTGLMELDVADAEARLRQQIDAQAFRIDDTGAKK